MPCLVVIIGGSFKLITDEDKTLPVTDTINQLRSRFKPEAARDLNATYLINVRGQGGGAWLTKINDGACEIVEATPNTPADCTISADVEDLEAILTGRMSAMTAALSGVLSIDGELGLAMQLVPIFFDGSPV
jgi:putative sterol carrier protein